MCAEMVLTSSIDYSNRQLHSSLDKSHTLTPIQNNHTSNDVLSRAQPQSFLVGASGGCYALIAAHFANIIINWGEMPFNWLRLLVLLTLMATDIGVFAYMTLTNSTTRVRRGLEGWGVCSGVVF